jgi:hypothetical protein
MAKAFSIGDHVQLNTPQGVTTGRIERKMTEPTDIGDHHMEASAEGPQYLVRSDKAARKQHISPMPWKNRQ